MRALFALAAAAGLTAIGTGADDARQNVEARKQVITRPGVVDQGVKPVWREPPPPGLPLSLTCAALPDGTSHPFAWDGVGYAGTVAGQRVYLNVYRGHAGRYGWTVSPRGMGRKPAAAYYGREVSRVPLVVEVPVAMEWGHGVVFRFTS